MAGASDTTARVESFNYHRVLHEANQEEVYAACAQQLVSHVVKVRRNGLSRVATKGCRGGGWLAGHWLLWHMHLGWLRRTPLRVQQRRNSTPLRQPLSCMRRLRRRRRWRQ